MLPDYPSLVLATLLGQCLTATKGKCVANFVNGSDGRDRTYDQLINSQLLYR